VTVLIDCIARRITAGPPIRLPVKLAGDLRLRIPHWHLD